MTRTELVLLSSAVLGLAACSAAQPGAPGPRSVEPAFGFSTSPTAVEIRGDAFAVKPVQELDGRGSHVDSGFRAWVGATELEAVGWVDAGRLTARVPAGLAPGLYDVAVEGPFGRGVLQAGFRVIVELPAALAATLALPPSLSIEAFAVTMTVSNVGDAAADDVRPAALAIAPGSTAAAGLVAGPLASVSIPGGQSATFTWTYHAETLGALQLLGSVTAVDRNDGGVRTAQAASNVAEVRTAARIVSSDALQDGISRFAFVAGYRGQLYVGPNSTGTGLVRMGYDGTAPEPLRLSFAVDMDTIGNISSNTVGHAVPPTPYTSIGYTGCATNSNACGPDNENGRGLLTSVRFGGEEWLVIGGARSNGDLDYVYLSRATASPLEFWYVDLSLALGGNTRGFSAALVSSDRLYLGFPDNGGNRPYGLALLAPPAAPGPGQNAALGSDVLDVNLADAFKKTAGGYASITMVDTIAELGGRIYLFSDPGIIVSTTATPATKDDFVNCSPPASAAYDERQSVEPTRQYDLEPRDRAWPQAAVWRGRLYAIRNTDAPGPQLWRCDPASGGDPTVCETAEWGLVAGDAANLTRFGTSATAASLLVATPDHLYVGLEDTTAGIHLFRTDRRSPRRRGALQGSRRVHGRDRGVPGHRPRRRGGSLGAQAHLRCEGDRVPRRPQ